MNTFESRMIFKTANALYLILDENGVCTGFFSPDNGLESISCETAMDRNFTEILPQSIEPFVGKAITQLDGEQSFRVFEFALDSGTWICLHAFYLETKGSYLIAIRDITEEKTTLELMQSNEKELENIATSIRHDMKNYVFKIKGYLSLLVEEDDFRYIERIRAIVEEMETVLDYLSNVILISREGTEITKIDLNQLVNKVARANIPPDIVFVQDELPMICGHRISVLQVFRNLIENAVIHGRPSKIEISAEQTDKGTVLRIVNDGTPFPEDVWKQMLSEQGEKEQRTLTDGLLIVKRLVEKHGWNIELVSRDPTTFEIIMPVEKMSTHGKYK